MKAQKFLLIAAIFLFIAMLLTSCFNNEEDPGPLQADERDFSILGFERLEMGEGLHVTVLQGAAYSVHVRGDRRNINDLDVRKTGATLKVTFHDFGNRDHTTYVTITMPELIGVNFSGASNSTIRGFKEASSFDLTLSGASVSQLDMEAVRTDFNLSGASRLTVSGRADKMVAKVSGASEIHTYNLNTMNADVDASGASKIKVFASATLNAVANGASEIYYRGNATVNASASGASKIKAD